MLNEECPCCEKKDCLSWVEYQRKPENSSEKIKSKDNKYKIGDKVWVSISHNKGNIGIFYEDPIEKTELPTCAEIDLWLDCVEVTCVSYDEKLQENLYDFEHDMVICTCESHLYATKDEAIDAMIEALSKMKA